jgi:hypothetical protein
MTDKTKISLNLNSDRWKKFRIRALEENKTATEIMEELIEKYLKNRN